MTAQLPFRARLRTSCIITNYNYGAYLPQAVESVLTQTIPFDEIIIVDDGSTDDSSIIISGFSARCATLKVVNREHNAGQLAGFETGIMQSDGDILFFLDADDVYALDYLAVCLDIYHKAPSCDFLFCGYKQFNQNSVPEVLSGSITADRRFDVTDLGLTVVRTIERRAFVGAPTSCLSLRRKLASRLFPIPLHDDWRTRADDCLVFGASLAGARKFRLEGSLVGYRLHGKNSFTSNPAVGEPQAFFLRQIALMRLFRFFLERLRLQVTELRRLAHLEFKTIPRPSRKDLFEYLMYVVKNGAHGAGRLRGIAVILKWYYQSRGNEETVSMRSKKGEGVHV